MRLLILFEFRFDLPPADGLETGSADRIKQGVTVIPAVFESWNTHKL
jgi:hypothetical protein